MVSAPPGNRRTPGRRGAEGGQKPKTRQGQGQHPERQHVEDREVDQDGRLPGRRAVFQALRDRQEAAQPRRPERRRQGGQGHQSQRMGDGGREGRQAAQEAGQPERHERHAQRPSRPLERPPQHEQERTRMRRLSHGPRPQGAAADVRQADRAQDEGQTRRVPAAHAGRAARQSRHVPRLHPGNPDDAQGGQARSPCHPAGQRLCPRLGRGRVQVPGIARRQRGGGRQRPSRPVQRDKRQDEQQGRQRGVEDLDRPAPELYEQIRPGEKEQRPATAPDRDVQGRQQVVGPAAREHAHQPQERAEHDDPHQRPQPGGRQRPAPRRLPPPRLRREGRRGHEGRACGSRRRRKDVGRGRVGEQCKQDVKQADFGPRQAAALDQQHVQRQARQGN